MFKFFLFNFKFFRLMKKFLFVLLAGALALPMMAQSKADEAAAMANCRHGITTSNTVLTKHAKVAAIREDIPAGYCAITLATDDVWGDGTGYQMLLDADATAYGTEFEPVGGSGVFSGNYDNFEYKIPENADSDLNTSNIVLDDAVTILIPAGVYDYAITNPSPADAWIWIASSNGTAGGRGNDIEFLAGAQYTFHVYKNGANDATDVDIYDPNAPVMPMNVTADEHANVAWDNDHDPLFNLRYRPYDPNVTQTFFWDFDTDESLEGWAVYDADADGYTWRLTTDGVDGTYCLTSDSYYSGARTPDNWAFSPEITLGGTLTFSAKNYSASYLDKFVVAVCVGDYEDGETVYLDKFVEITDFIQPANAWEEFTVEIPENLRGEKGHFAFHHYDCTDQWRVHIDNVAYTIPGNEPAEWIVVEGIEGNEYTIEGLEDGVTYEVQVQAVNEAGQVTDWTESALFTYEAGDVPQPTEKTGAPVFNGYTTDGIHAYFIEIQESEPSTIYYRVQYGQDGEFTEWAEYEDILSFTEDGWYRIEAYAVADGKLPSDPIAYEFIVNPATGLSEMTGSKTVAGVRYFNAMGQEMQEANGLTIVVTTYTDGTTSTAKVMK